MYEKLSTERLLQKLQSNHLAIERYCSMGNEAMEKIALQTRDEIKAELERRRPGKKS